MNIRYLLLLILTCLCLISEGVHAVDFMRGVDISMHSRQVSDGVVYNEYGISRDVLDILIDHDINWVRIRLFHSPDGTDYGVCQDLDYVTELADEIKGRGLKFLLDIHYSDTWADPASQNIPVQWQSYSHLELVTAVYDYTYAVIDHLRSNDAMPDMVQIGNETTCGMLWPDGKFCGSETQKVNYVDLVNAAYSGIAAASSGIIPPEIMIHIDRGGSKSTSQWFFSEIISRGINFDIIGLSFYPEWHGTVSDLAENVNNLASMYDKQICIVEIGKHYTSLDGESPQSQKKFIEDILQVVQAIPDGKGRGLCYWEPTWTWRSANGYRALFAPIDSQWDNVEMLMGLEAFNVTDKYSLYSHSVSGSVSGEIMDGHSSDNKYESITEVLSGDGEYNILEHKWSINNVNGYAVFVLEAYKSSDNDDGFVFAYSVDNIDYIDMFAIASASDEDSLMSYKLPADISGTVYIRLTDTNRQADDDHCDTVYIDNMYIYTGVDTPGVNICPSELYLYEQGAASGELSISLASKPYGDIVISLSESGSVGQVELSQTTIEFNSDNWAVPQLVTISAVDDDIQEDMIHISAVAVDVISNVDINYRDVTVEPLEILIEDNECGVWGYLPADLFADCEINIKDLAVFAQYWLQ